MTICSAVMEGEPHPQPVDPRERIRRMNEAREAKLAAMSPEERAAYEEAIKEKMRAKAHLSGRKPTGNKQFPNGRPSRSKYPDRAKIKELFETYSIDAVKEIWQIMTHSRSEALAASSLWLDRALGKVPTVVEGPGGGQVTFQIITGVPSSDDEDHPRGTVVDMPRLPNGTRDG